MNTLKQNVFVFSALWMLIVLCLAINSSKAVNTINLFVLSGDISSAYIKTGLPSDPKIEVPAFDGERGQASARKVTFFRGEKMIRLTPIEVGGDEQCLAYRFFAKKGDRVNFDGSNGPLCQGK